MALTTEEFIEKAKRIHGDKYDYSKVEYVNAVTKVCVICPEHGEFWQSPAKHLMGQGCKRCKEYKLEKMVSLLLSKNNIRFQQWKHFKWLDTSSKGHMSLDFYLPDHNIAIECQGEQHFKPTSFSSIIRGTEEEYINFIHRIELDAEKNKRCKEHGIDIIYFYEKRKYNLPNIYIEENLFLRKKEIITYICNKYPIH